jgi:hypothetical protein
MNDSDLQQQEDMVLEPAAPVGSRYLRKLAVPCACSPTGGCELTHCHRSWRHDAAWSLPIATTVHSTVLANSRPCLRSSAALQRGVRSSPMLPISQRLCKVSHPAHFRPPGPFCVARFAYSPKTPHPSLTIEHWRVLEIFSFLIRRAVEATPRHHRDKSISSATLGSLNGHGRITE